MTWSSFGSPFAKPVIETTTGPRSDGPPPRSGLAARAHARDRFVSSMQRLLIMFTRQVPVLGQSNIFLFRDTQRAVPAAGACRRGAASDRLCEYPDRVRAQQADRLTVE